MALERDQCQVGHVGIGHDSQREPRIGLIIGLDQFYAEGAGVENLTGVDLATWCHACDGGRDDGEGDLQVDGVAVGAGVDPPGSHPAAGDWGQGLVGDVDSDLPLQTADVQVVVLGEQPDRHLVVECVDEDDVAVVIDPDALVVADRLHAVHRGVPA